MKNLFDANGKMIPTNPNDEVIQDAQSRYDALGNMTMDEIMGKDKYDLPLPDEAIKAKMERDRQNLKNSNQFTSTNITPTMELNTESFYMPSKNLLYGDSFDGHFNLRMFTTKEERIRLSSTTSFLETMVSILNNCISTTNGTVIDTKLLTEFDFIYVMYMSRIVSYGPMYAMTVNCPHCHNTYRYKANLDDLNVVYLDEDFKEPFKIGPLPKSGDILEIRYLRIYDIIDIEKEGKEILLQDPDYQGDPTYNGKIERRIVSVNGKQLSNYEKKIYVENLSAYDNQYINYKVSQISKAGIDISSTATCPICGKDTPITLSVTSTFFRPEFDD